MSEPTLLLLIPMKIVEDERLNSAQMILYSLIYSGRAGHDDGYYCRFENSHFSRIMKTSESSVLRHLKALEDCGLIEREIIRDEKTNEMIKRRIYIL